MVKKKFWKTVFKQIKEELSRFLAMFAIVVLGIGVITGLYVSTPNMQTSVDDYYVKYNMADIHVVSTIGFNSDVVLEIEELESIKEIEKVNIKEVKAEVKGSKLTSLVYEKNLEDLKVNKLELLEGRMPTNNSEILVERSDYYLKDIAVNTKVVLTEEDDVTRIGNKKEYTVVGIVGNPWYFSKEAEKTRLGAETIQAIFYKNIEENTNTFTDIFVTINRKTNSHSFKKQYINEVKDVSKDLKAVSQYMLKKQKESIIEDLVQQGIPQVIIDEIIKEIDKIDKEWYILDRTTNISYQTFNEFVKKVDSIAQIFPIFFLLVAALVVMTTMTRMVEEERQQIGVLRALGYAKKDIYSKYIIYALIIGVIGTLTGYAAGFRLLPAVIYQAFDNVFHLPPLNLKIYSLLNIIVMILMVLVILLSTVLAVNKTLKQTPANLLLPRAPKQGKRILLERIPFIWKRLKFKYKSSLRNVFRYPKHLLMTILGVAGSLALVFTGFGISDAIQAITKTQFDDIYKYDFAVNIDSLNPELEQYLNTNFENNILIMQEGGYLTTEKTEEMFYVDILIVDDNQDINAFINLRNRKGKKEIKISNNGVIITEQIAKNLKLKEKDKFKLNGKNTEFIVDGITENYIGNKIYMTKNYFENNYTHDFKYNKVLVTSKEKIKDEEKLKNEILEYDGTIGVDYLSTERLANDRLLSQINIITIILVAAAGMLNIIVIYNLTNVNISEREKEIATLKVLGYKQNEVAGYIYREIAILTILGILLGLVFGYFLQRYIVLSIDSTNLMMGRNIKWTTFVLSILLTIIFTIVVEVLMYFKIKKINMIDALKAN